MRKVVNRRRLIIRLSLVVVWIGLGVILFIVNRGHSILVDNRNLENPSIRAPDLITVTINNLKPLEFFRGDRDLFKVRGGQHRITIEFSDGTPTFQAMINVPLWPDIFLLSIPKLINGIEPYIEVFYMQPQTRNEAEEEEEEVIVE